MNIKLKNNITFCVLCTIMGSCVGLIIWLLLKVMTVGIEFIWQNSISRNPLYIICVCVISGALMGVLHKFSHSDYPEEMQTVMYKVKNEKYYPYDKILIIIPCVLLPLLCGASVGPEAGLTCLVTCLCYWISDNVKFAKENKARYTQVGVSAALGVLFHSPLFGIFQPAEDSDNDGKTFELPSENNILPYALAALGGIGIYSILCALFGGGMGLPQFKADSSLAAIDYIMCIVYVLCGVIMGLMYRLFEKINNIIYSKIPVLIREILGGCLLALCGILLPLTMFSGEEQAASLMETAKQYSPFLLIVVAAVKMFLTCSCISSGLKGGHFFPLIFCAIAMGYGVTALVQSAALPVNSVCAIAVITAALLGMVLGKPFAVTALLFIMFPIRYVFIIFLVSAFCSKIAGSLKKSKLNFNKEIKQTN